MFPIQSRNQAGRCSGAMAAHPGPGVLPQADLATCQQYCSDRSTEAAFRICVAACTGGQV